MELNEILDKNYPNILKFFDKNYIDFVDESNIDEYLNNDILKIDKLTDIYGVYKDVKKVEHGIAINKNNFYFAYADKLWKNLTLQEKAQVIKWHFDYLKNRYNYSRVDFKFTIATKKQGIKQWAFAGSMCPQYDHKNPAKDKILIKINPEALFEDNQYKIGQWIEHEMQHLKQNYYKKHQYKLGAENVNVDDIYELNSMLPGSKMKLFIDDQKELKTLKFFLYKTSLKEKSAELTGLKRIKKIFGTNKKIGLTNIGDSIKINEVKNYVLYQNYKENINNLHYNVKDKKTYFMEYIAEKHSDKIAELNFLGTVLVHFNMSETEIYKKIHDYTINFIKHPNWDKEYVKSLYNDVLKLNLKDDKFDYGKIIKKYYTNKYENNKEQTK